MSSVVFGLSFGVNNPSELGEVRAICQKIAELHPDTKPDLERLLELVVTSAKGIPERNYG